MWFGIRDIPFVALDDAVTTDLIGKDGAAEHYDSNNFPLPKKGDRLVFTVTMPGEAEKIENPVLCFFNYNSVIRIEEDGKTIFEHGADKQENGYTTGHTVVRVPVGSAAGSTVTIEFLQQEDNTLSSLSSVFLMPAQYSWLYPVFSLRKQVSLALFMVFAFFSVLVLVYSAVFSVGRQEMLQGFMLSLFCLSMTAWALGFSGTLFVLTSDDTFVPYAEYAATYLMAIFFCGYMLNGAASYGWRKKVTAALEVFFIAIFTASTLMQLFSPEHNGYLIMLNICQGMLGCSGIYFMILVFRDRTSAGRVFRAGMTLTLLLAFLEVAFAAAGRMIPMNDGIEKQFAMEKLTPIVVLVFQATLLADYVSRVYRAYQSRKEFQRLEMVAYTDALTGLDSRASFEDRELPKLAQAEGYAIAFIDADGLKEKNDRFGHTEGDRLLQEISRAIRRGCRGTDCQAFRYGGDEFLIVGKSRDRVQTAVAGMQKELEEDGSLSVSFGIAEHQTPSPLSVSDVIREADSLMYSQKKRKHVSRAQGA